VKKDHFMPWTREHEEILSRELSSEKLNMAFSLCGGLIVLAG